MLENYLPVLVFILVGIVFGVVPLVSGSCFARARGSPT